MYRSPFRFIDAAVLPSDAVALKRALLLEKKKLLAEFELEGTASIELSGHELHRQDVLGMFEELANPLSLLFHRAIWEDETLLFFLEEGRMIPGRRWADNSLYQNTTFLLFVSQHFADACNAFIQRALNTDGAAEELHALRQNDPLMLASDTETAYRYASRFFTEKKNELLALRHRVDSNEQVTTAEIRHWSTDEQIHLLNRLPPAFSALRYDIANTLNNLCVAFDRKNAGKHALAAIERAATIRFDDEELGQLIPANLRIIRDKQSTGFFNTNPDTGRRTPKIGWVIMLFIVIIRMATTDGCNDKKTDFSSLPKIQYEYKGDDPWKRELFPGSDSLTKVLTGLDSLLKKTESIKPLRSPGKMSVPQEEKRIPVREDTNRGGREGGDTFSNKVSPPEGGP